MSGALTESAPRAQSPPQRGAILDPQRIRARAQHENFPVALWLLGSSRRRHLRAIYGFARLADDLGDEIEGERSQWLDWLDRELDRVYTGFPMHPITQELQATVRALHLPQEPFHHLIEANRLDQIRHRYQTFDELCAYCALSADPVGRLVLHVFRAVTPRNVQYSDAVCTGLQLAEHWQDVAEDLRRGRLYIPLEDLERFACSEESLGAAVASRHVRALMRFEVERARQFLIEGLPLVRELRGSERFAVAAFIAGGLAALASIERADFDVLKGAPKPTRLDLGRQLLWVLRAGARAS